MHLPEVTHFRADHKHRVAYQEFHVSGTLAIQSQYVRLTTNEDSLRVLLYKKVLMNPSDIVSPVSVILYSR